MNKKRNSDELSGQDDRRSRRKLLVIAGIVLVVTVGILAIPYYQTYIAPFNRIIIIVDDVRIPMQYFLERTRLASSDPVSMLQLITEEQVIKLAAVQYDIQVTDTDIDRELRSSASQGSENISEAEYKEWYRQQLNSVKLSDFQFREIVRNRMLADRVQAYLADRVPPAHEQIHLHLIVVNNYEDAQKASDRLKAGGDFAVVAQEFSTDAKSKEMGGDLGWLPPILVLPYFQSQISALKVNQTSEPLPYFDQTGSAAGTAAPSAYYIFKVSEKDSVRPLEEPHLQILKERALELWLPKAIEQHSVKYNFNSEILAWLNWQLKDNG